MKKIMDEHICYLVYCPINQYSNTIMAYLSKNKPITVLIQNCELNASIAKMIVKLLQNNERLEKLSFGNILPLHKNQIDDDTIQDIIYYLEPQLRYLDVSVNSDITHIGLENILHWLSKNPKLEYLDISDNYTKKNIDGRLFIFLTKNTHLKELNGNLNNYSADTVNKIYQYLVNNKTLKNMEIRFARCANGDIFLNLQPELINLIEIKLKI